MNYINITSRRPQVGAVLDAYVRSIVQYLVQLHWKQTLKVKEVKVLRAIHKCPEFKDAWGFNNNTFELIDV